MLKVISALAAISLLTTGDARAQFSVTDTFSFRIMEKSPAHPYYGVGDTVSYSVDGVEGGTITMARDSVYAWVHANMNVVDAPYIATVSTRGVGFYPYSRARVGDDFENRIRFFKLPSDAPDTLFYASTDWRWAGGMILVVDSLVSSVKDENGTFHSRLLSTSSVAPNPVISTAILSFSLNEPTSLRIEVYDVLGRIVQSSAFSAESGSVQTPISAGGLFNGTYFYRVIQDDGELLTTGSFNVR